MPIASSHPVRSFIPYLQLTSRFINDIRTDRLIFLLSKLIEVLRVGVTKFELLNRLIRTFQWTLVILPFSRAQEERLILIRRIKKPPEGNPERKGIVIWITACSWLNVFCSGGFQFHTRSFLIQVYTAYDHSSLFVITFGSLLLQIFSRLSFSRAVVEF